MEKTATSHWRGMPGDVGQADGDVRLNWPGVTLHIPTTELGVMGEK